MSIRFEKKVVEDIRRGDRDEVTAYLLSNGNPNATDNDGRPLLVVATRANKPAIVDMLVAHNARLDATDKEGNTALHWAADAGHVSIARSLVDAGIDIDMQNRQGLTPLLMAVRGGNLNMVRALIAAGADPRMVDYTGSRRLWLGHGAARSAAGERAEQGAMTPGRARH